MAISSDSYYYYYYIHTFKDNVKWSLMTSNTEQSLCKPSSNVQSFPMNNYSSKLNVFTMIYQPQIVESAGHVTRNQG